MPTRRYVVKSSVEETYQMIRLSQSMDSIVFKELRDFGDDKKMATIACEQYYIRTSNRIALFITIHNFSGVTEVTAISTGSSQSMLFKFDWGAAQNYLKMITDALKPVLISNKEKSPD